MRIRLPFAGTFIFLSITAGYGGLSPNRLSASANKVLHIITFFVITTNFYWILDTSRRRSTNLTLIFCAGTLGIGCEFLQAFFGEDHRFDFINIFANLAGSLAALGLSSWYHSRMLSRKRSAKLYQSIPGEDDIELGTGSGSRDPVSTDTQLPSIPSDQEIENWNLEESPSTNEEEDVSLPATKGIVDKEHGAKRDL